MEDQELRKQVAWACRILARQGHTDFTLGHVSARSSENTVLIKRSGLGLNEIMPEDVLTVDLDCRKLRGEGEVHLESVLHTEVYKARSDVGAVIHTHPPYATAMGAAKARLELINHDAVLFYDGIAVFEDTVELITSPAQGELVASALGNCRVVLLRNHGVLVVGKDVPWAVITALTLERAVQIQSIAATLGPLQPISLDIAEQFFPAKYKDTFIKKYWHKGFFRRHRTARDNISRVN
jgi:L-ribulose-5-phosphate 4-epimerase